jgi:NAD(P)-dependent dehydrogenase (short-subunit alcohol dehydrogenase family)
LTVGASLDGIADSSGQQASKTTRDHPTLVAQNRQMSRLEGKVVLVTGSTMGIGRAIATTVASEGAKVVVTGRSADKGNDVAREITSAGGIATYIKMDVTQPVTVEAAVAATLDLYGRLDGVVNNAADMELVRIDRPVTELPIDDWNLIIASDLTSTFLGMKYGIKAMLVGGRGGSVVNISSSAGLRGLDGVDAYTASKGGVIALTRSVASYYARYDVRCNALAVGFVDTGSDRVKEMLADEAFSSEVLQHHLGMIGTPADVAPAAVFLLSDESRFVTGTTIPVDGGAVTSSHLSRKVVHDIPEFPRLRPSPPCA